MGLSHEVGPPTTRDGHQESATQLRVRARQSRGRATPTDPMVEREERQAFAPKVVGSSPTGTHCDRRGEKTISGLFFSSSKPCGQQNAREHADSRTGLRM